MFPLVDLRINIFVIIKINFLYNQSECIWLAAEPKAKDLMGSIKTQENLCMISIYVMFVRSSPTHAFINIK